jgi:hypothetical protein
MNNSAVPISLSYKIQQQRACTHLSLAIIKGANRPKRQPCITATGFEQQTAAKKDLRVPEETTSVFWRRDRWAICSHDTLAQFFDEYTANLGGYIQQGEMDGVTD